MRIDVKFSEKDCSFAPDFGEVQVVSGDTGGYSQAEMEAAVAAATEAGKQAEYDRFWDDYQSNGDVISYQGAFSGKRWNDTTYNPKYPIRCNSGYGAYQLFFQNSIITDTKVPIELHGSMLNTTFSGCTNLVTIPCLKLINATDGSSAFSNCNKLTNITVDGSIAFDISFASSPLLTAESVDSVIAALTDLTGQTAKKLTVHATVGANMTEAQKATITAKNWTLVY